MLREFVTKDIAIEMFNIGFDELCIKFHWIDQDKPKWMGETNSPSKLHRQKYWKENNDLYTISIPTFSQCFRWFREKYNLHSNISSWRSDDNLSFYHEFEIYSLESSHYTGNLYFTYEEAELECIKQLIEIAKTKTQK
jgi:hypothetical protein